MKVDLILQNCRLTGGGFSFSGDTTTLGLHFVAPVIPDQVKELGEGIFNTLYRTNGRGQRPLMNPVKSYDPGASMQAAKITMVRYVGGNKEAYEGRISFLKFHDADNGRTIELKFTAEADEDLWSMVRAQRKDVLESFRLEGDLKGAEVQQVLDMEEKETADAGARA